MIRTLALVIVLGIGVGTARAEPAPKPTKPEATKPEALPLPKDAKTSPTAAFGGGGKIIVYDVPRARDAVVTEMRDLFKKGGWTISKDDASPSGRAVRLEVKKGDTLYKVSFTGDATRTALIVTNP